MGARWAQVAPKVICDQNFNLICMGSPRNKWARGATARGMQMPTEATPTPCRRCLAVLKPPRPSGLAFGTALSLVASYAFPLHSFCTELAFEESSLPNVGASLAHSRPTHASASADDTDFPRKTPCADCKLLRATVYAQRASNVRPTCAQRAPNMCPTCAQRAPRADLPRAQGAPNVRPSCAQRAPPRGASLGRAKLQACTTCAQRAPNVRPRCAQCAPMMRLTIGLDCNVRSRCAQGAPGLRAEAQRCPQWRPTHAPHADNLRPARAPWQPQVAPCARPSAAAKCAQRALHKHTASAQGALSIHYQYYS